MEEINLKTTLDKDIARSLQSHLIKNEIKEVDVALFFEVIEFIKKDRAEQLILSSVSNCATSMEEILNEAQRRKAKHSVQYADYSMDTWTVSNDLLEDRKNVLLSDGSVRKVRIEYEM
jgi:hypothetical protein